MSRPAEGLRRRRGVGEGLDGLRAVVGRDSCGATVQFIDGHGEGGSQYGGVVLNLMGQVQFLTAFYGDGCAEHATGIFQHEVHLFGRDLLGGDDQVAFVLAVLVVDDNHEFAGLEVLYGFIDSIES